MWGSGSLWAGGMDARGFPAAAAVAIVLAAAPASGGPTASSAMPTVGGRITLKLSGCPALPRAAGCVYRRRPRTIYVRAGLRHPRAVLPHELGHLYDLRVMNNSDRGRFRRIMRARKRAWCRAGSRSRSSSPRHTRSAPATAGSVSIARYSTYDYRPSRRQHTRVCALVLAAAVDRTPPAAAADRDADPEPDPAARADAPADPARRRRLRLSARACRRARPRPS